MSVEAATIHVLTHQVFDYIRVRYGSEKEYVSGKHMSCQAFCKNMYQHCSAPPRINIPKEIMPEQTDAQLIWK